MITKKRQIRMTTETGLSMTQSPRQRCHAMAPRNAKAHGLTGRPSFYRVFYLFIYLFIFSFFFPQRPVPSMNLTSFARHSPWQTEPAAYGERLSTRNTSRRGGAAQPPDFLVYLCPSVSNPRMEIKIKMETR